MANLMNLMKVIISQPLDLQPLRATYSFELCGLLASMVAKDRSARPPLNDVLQLPFVLATPQAVELALGRDGAQLATAGGAQTAGGGAQTAPPEPTHTGEGVLSTAGHAWDRMCNRTHIRICCTCTYTRNMYMYTYMYMYMYMYMSMHVHVWVCEVLHGDQTHIKRMPFCRLASLSSR